MARIYISFAQKDRQSAQRLTAGLETAGHSIIETPLEPATNWTAAAARSIPTADVFLVLISPSAVGSRVTEREIGIATTHRKPIIPILLQDTVLPDSLARFQYLDARHNWDAMLTQLTSSIDAVAGLTGGLIPQVATPASRPRRRWALLRILTLVILVTVVALLILLTMNNSAPTPNNVQTVQAVYMTNTAVSIVLRASQTARSWTGTPVQTSVPTSTPPETPTRFNDSTLTGTEQRPVSVTVTQANLETEIAGRVQATISAMAVAPTPTMAALLPTPDLSQVVGATVVAMRATDQNKIAATAFRQLADIAIRANESPDRSLALVLSVLATLLAVGSMIAIWATWMRVRGSGSTSLRDADRQPGPSVITGKQSSRLETYEVFISSSDIDKAWVTSLTKDLDELGFLVWWYAKDAPGLSFGQMIKSAIFYTKVFVVIISPDSMRSKHVEEEIRWADNFGRPLIPILYRPTPIQDRLYGLAKDADIDFTHQGDYKGSLELLTQAISHYLKQRVQDLQGEANPSANPPKETGPKR